MWAMPFRPALPMNRAVFHRLGLSVGIAIALAGCERNSNAIARQEALVAERAARRAFDDAYDRCLYRVTGPFASASIEVMRECQKLAAQGMSAGTAKTPQAVECEARQPGPRDAPKTPNPSGGNNG